MPYQGLRHGSQYPRIHITRAGPQQDAFRRMEFVHRISLHVVEDVGTPVLLDNAQTTTDLLQYIECELQLLPSMRCRDNRPYPRPGFGHGRIPDALSEDPFCEELI